MVEVKITDLNIEDEYAPISQKLTVRQAAQIMKEQGLPDLVVINEKEEPIGVVTESILVREVLANPDADPDKMTVEEIMKKIEPVDIDTKLEDAAKYLYDNNLPLVPVVENKKLIGVLTVSDILLGLQKIAQSK
ncbi:MAG: CBS domain-containing protein [Candidatus Odinarchaeota archaeon]|nr:CBS domain-containing protein [Candidatus Odinarchaeota archaeon]